MVFLAKMLFYGKNCLERAVSSESKEYNHSDSVLKGTELGQLAGFSAKLVLKNQNSLPSLECKHSQSMWEANQHHGENIPSFQ